MIPPNELEVQIGNDLVRMRKNSTYEYLGTIDSAGTISNTDLNVGGGNGPQIAATKKVGKVRDSYTDGEDIILITSDRLSAFDRHIALIPFKGAVLNLVSEYWFNETKHIMPNHFKSSPHANVTIGTLVQPIPIEFVVRRYLAGSTGTSILTHYKKGVRKYCGIQLPDGLKPNQRFDQSIITPTTKSDVHDELTSGEEIVAQGIMTQNEWDYVSAKLIELFNFAATKAAKRGLILVDTKIEMGRTPNGEIIITDEIFTPDSSRYWVAEGYEEAFASGRDPENIDKDFIRKWVQANCTDPYKVAELPVVPKEQIAELSRRYILLYELITGLNFPFSRASEINNLNANVTQALTWERAQDENGVRYTYLRPNASMKAIVINSDGMINVHIKPVATADKILEMLVKNGLSGFKLAEQSSEQITLTAGPICNHKILDKVCKKFGIAPDLEDKRLLPKPKVAVIMGSDSDLPTMQKAAETLEGLGVPVEITLVSAHRTAARLMEYARAAHTRGINVIIAGAGGAAHLPGMVASMTPLPVIGVPVVPPTAAQLGGVDALLSMLQMPTEVPVATVAIGNATNAALLAARMLGMTDLKLQARILQRQEDIRSAVIKKAQTLETNGWRDYNNPTEAQPAPFLLQFGNEPLPVVTDPANVIDVAANIVPPNPDNVVDIVAPNSALSNRNNKM